MSFLQQVVLTSWWSNKQTREWSLRWWKCVRVCKWRGNLSPELYLTSHSPLLHTPCQQVGPYLSPTELSHWVHTWPCHYLVPGFVSTLLSPFCVFPDFPFPHYLNKDKNSLFTLCHQTHTLPPSLVSHSPLCLWKKPCVYYKARPWPWPSMAVWGVVNTSMSSFSHLQSRGRTRDQTFSSQVQSIFNVVYWCSSCSTLYSLHTMN